MSEKEPKEKSKEEFLEEVATVDLEDIPPVPWSMETYGIGTFKLYDKHHSRIDPAKHLKLIELVFGLGVAAIERIQKAERKDKKPKKVNIM
jgi:hypothetical protein